MSTQQPANQSNPPTQKEHIVAYLEIMDCEKKMQNPQDSDVLLAQLAYIYNDMEKWPDRVKAGGHPDIEVKIFSNNVVIAMEIGDDDHYPANCYSVAKFCIGFQTMALTYGLFLHGAITVGKFVDKEHQSLFAYGEALVKAYSLTAENAALPCVVIDNCIFRNASQEELLKNETLAEMYLQDEDGKHFLNPFRIFKSFKTQYKNFITRIIKEIREMLLSEYAKTLIDKSISSEKHYFVLNQFNKYCSNHKEYGHLQIPIEIFDTPWVMPNKPRAELKTILDKNPPEIFTPPRQNEYIVAHIDFLGAAQKMTSPEDSDDFLGKIYEIYTKGLELLNKAEKNGLPPLDIKIFSDNIVIALRTDYNIDKWSNYSLLARACIMFQILALSRNLVFRGAITIGNFYIDDTFVFGEAIARANKLEEAAKFPRVIVDAEDAINILKVAGKFKGLLKQDKDYRYFVSPFSINNDEFSEDDIISYLKNARKFICAEYSESENQGVKEKYHWLANQFNEYCHANNHPFLINLDKLTLEGKNEY